MLLFLAHNESLSFSGLPLEALRLKDGKSMDAGGHRHCKDMKYFLKSLKYLSFCTEGQGNHQMWDEKVLGGHLPFAASTSFCFLMFLCTSI